MVDEMADLIINEMLCFLKKFGRIPQLQLSTILIGFYDEKEIWEAKRKLSDFAEQVGDIKIP